MTQFDDLASIAAQLQRSWESGRICALIGRGCHARVLRIARLVDQGRLSHDDALKAARETEAVALCLAPLPHGDVP
ncbi:hypothetical protein E8E01_01035 [Methylorubrum populi]|uniref:hypothetical protein n=1 Tax=Methylorubrum TaxID=2282523 RepID=UPI001152A1FB|nr:MULTISPECIES: hypothetical protein [Methylorubrum]MCG5246856.1 hypothetical protein [Methylorubrum extorquens]QDI79115.1 hypothetical protein E8E01_01035 [Methylorubrum populi]UGB24782.1 hypothetical protein LPC10_17785 [Methylorubrum sp. B1-46]